MTNQSDRPDGDGLPEVTDEMLTAAMRAFEQMSSVLRYREKDKWHSCDIMGMRDAIRAAIATRDGAEGAGDYAAQAVVGKRPTPPKPAPDAVRAGYTEDAPRVCDCERSVHEDGT